MAGSAWPRWQAAFERDATIYWANLSRLTNLLIVLNITLFFLTGLVTEHGYYYTFYSLTGLGLVELALLVPHGRCSRLWFYLACLAVLAVAVWFLVVSGWYWIVTTRA